MKRLVVVALAKVDAAVDAIAYRPAVVKLFGWVPRWWNCAVARLSVQLDERWSTGYWDDGAVPGRPCAACRRRASIFTIESPDGALVGLCGWCHVVGPILTDDDLERELAAASSDSVSWRWRWRAGRRSA